MELSHLKRQSRTFRVTVKVEKAEKREPNSLAPSPRSQINPPFPPAPLGREAGNERLASPLQRKSSNQSDEVGELDG